MSTSRLYHVMRAHEGFDETARMILAVLRLAVEKNPGEPRVFGLDVEGHRNAAGGFDRDAFEVQGDFLLCFLRPYFSEILTPLYTVKTRGQRDEVSGLQVSGIQLSDSGAEEQPVAQTVPEQRRLVRLLLSRSRSRG